MNPEESRKFIRILVSDINQCAVSLKSGESPEFWSRAYLHAYGAFIEGVVVTYKSFFIHFHEIGVFTIKEESLLFLRGSDWKLDGKKIKVFEKKMPTKDSLKFLLIQAAELIPDYNPDLQGKGWSEILKFYEARDSITHPKSSDCLSVKPEKIAELDIGRQWLVNEVLTINKLTTVMLNLAEENG